MLKTGNNQTLLTDLYELTMAAAYFRYDMYDPATFSLFIRHYPADRGYFVSAELETLQTQVVREVKIKELGES